MTPFWNDLSTNLTAVGRIWTAAAPALLLITYLLLGLLAYALRGALVGRFHDEEMDTRGLGGLTTARARHFFAWLMRPLWRGLAAAEVPPNAITTLSVGLALGAGVALAAGRFALGGWLYVCAGALDFLDGRVARETGRASSGGAALDSVLDRYCESAVIVGLCWYYRQSFMLFPCLLALTGSLFVPYVRARGEALGATMKDVGFMQRPERILVLGLSVALSPIVEAIRVPFDLQPPHLLAMAGVGLVAVTSHITAIQRLVHLVSALGDGGNADHRPLPRSIVVSVLATALDFTVVRVLVHTWGLSAPLATALGCVAGGVLAFTLSRTWVFEARSGSRAHQALRFVFVSGTSAALNAGGVALLLLFPAMGDKLAWAVTRLVVFLTWNYPLLRDHVFARGLREARRMEVSSSEEPEAGPVSLAHAGGTDGNHP
ncbi:GtrA family protein [Chondromyces apiculatus]|uniref:CDP-diacylglycerol--glycerol-3-phosphate 3-phosphatidyltransferase n=1 Tax=Chondromyces apiculatus DSM 436 TaxID=1192034 RepID=A0A017TAH9_9BACT|nr:GtrA family protein [Chondromyces apiculatus]EYF05596.1 CDP-diacylglycerol--glycerol-3-phosphate 3-phosphatidyltransferase [Chondromyces apiculatus DSM 436]